MPIFKGSTEACLDHLRIAIDDDYVAKRHVLGLFVGVGDQTIRRWFKKELHPVGEGLIRLRFYLEFLGYEVEELELLDRRVRDIARIYAFGVITLQFILDETNFSAGSNGTSVLLSVFRGVRGISNSKYAQLVALTELYSGKLAAKQAKTKKVLLGNGTAVAKPVLVITPPAALPPRLAAYQPQGSHLALIESLAGLVKAAIPLARELESDEFTAEDRALVRELAGGDGVHRLANMLFRICGERARGLHSS